MEKLVLIFGIFIKVVIIINFTPVVVADVGYENVALSSTGTTCVASTEYGPGRYKCAGAIDGMYGYGDKKEWASHHEDVGAWLDLTLPHTYRIVRVKIVSRNGALRDRAKDVDINFHNGNTGIRVILDKTNAAHESVENEGYLKLPQMSRKVRLTVASIYEGPGGNVGFQEVEIYVCKTGWYGNTCDDVCHCEDNANDCDAANGEEDACVCVSGYHKFGSSQCVKDCDPDRYGRDCEHRCHCTTPEGCHQVTGAKDACICKKADMYYKDGAVCVLGSAPTTPLLVNEQVNSGQPGHVNCTASGKPIPELTLVITPTVTFTPRDTDGNDWRKRTFSLQKLTKDMTLTCTASNAIGDKSSGQVTPTVSEQPKLTNAPVVKPAARSVQATWQKWDNSQAGDGPVDKYTVYWRAMTETQWFNKTKKKKVPTATLR